MASTSAINNLSGASAGAGNGGTDAVAPQASSATNRDMFTKLLVAQIQNQDPLQPQDPTTYVNQLSQLSQTEALQNLSSTTTASASVLQSLQMLAMGGQVGSNVTVATDKLTLDGSKVNGTIQLNGASNDTALVLTGADGQQHKIDLGPGSGAQAFTIDPAALGLAPGAYTIQAMPSDGSAAAVEVSSRLNSVRVTSAGALLQVANIGEVAPSSITGFNGKTGS
jgi:flagellar basal-body rod modification protein FlgD